MQNEVIEYGFTIEFWLIMLKTIENTGNYIKIT